MNQLASRATKIKHFFRDKEQKQASKGWGPHLVSLMNTDLYDGVAIPKEVKIRVVEIIRGKPYSCPTLKAAKTKNSSTSNGKFMYAFDILKEAQIFDYFLKDQQIWLIDGHKIASTDEINDKKNITNGISQSKHCQLFGILVGYLEISQRRKI